MNTADRLWAIAKNARDRPDNRPDQVASISMQDTIFARMLWDSAVDERKFKTLFEQNEPLRRWAEEHDDEVLLYILWLHRDGLH